MPLPLIRVRVVSERVGRDGRYYGKKAVVQDVASRTHSTIQMDEDGQVLEHVSHADIETALPKAGGDVLVVAERSRFHGERGRLLSRDSKTEKAQVQLYEEQMIETFYFEQVAEAIGGAGGGGGH